MQSGHAIKHQHEMKMVGMQLKVRTTDVVKIETRFSEKKRC